MKTGGAMGTNSATGGTDILGAGALNMQFDMMAVLLQQQTFLAAAALADPKVQRALVEEQRKAAERLRIYAERGSALIERGRATTTFTPVQDAKRYERIATAFGAHAVKRGLVPTNLRVFDNLVRQRGLRPLDMADVMAASVAVCYQIAKDLTNWDISAKALADLRSATRTLVLEDAEYRGMSDAEKHTLHDFLIVWVVASVADYEQARQITFSRIPYQRVQQRAVEAIQSLMGVPIDRLRFTETAFSIEPSRERRQ